MPSSASSFQFNAHAVGLSGHITEPFDARIEAQATTAIPPAGGYSRAEQREFRLESVCEFRRASTETYGSFNRENNSFDTSATAVVEDLRLLDRVRIGRIVARLTATVPVDGDQPRFESLASHIDGLEIDGRWIETSRNDPAPWPGNEGMEEGVYATAPLFAVRSAGGDGVEASGNTILIPNFGRIHLGEMLVGRFSRSLTMVQVELGSPVRGNITAGVAFANGQRPYLAPGIGECSKGHVSVRTGPTCWCGRPFVR